MEDDELSDLPIRDRVADTNAYKLLALEIIKQALEDLIKPRSTGKAHVRNVKESANQFLFGPDDDLKFWCERAEVKPWQVRLQAGRLLEEVDSGKVKKPSM